MSEDRHCGISGERLLFNKKKLKEKCQGKSCEVCGGMKQYKTVIFSSGMGNAKVRLSRTRLGGHLDLKDTWCMQEEEHFPRE